MNEDGSYQGSGNDMSSEVQHGPPLDSETASEIQGKSIENTLKAASESIMQSKMSEVHSDLIGRSPYGLWMSAGTSVMGNVDWRHQGASHESSQHWSSLLPVSCVPAGKNLPFECAQKISSRGTSHNTDTERVDSGMVMKWKDTTDFRPGREHEQFNLWKMASLIRGISPLEKDKRNSSDVRDEVYHCGSVMDGEKIVERLWNDRRLKMKSLSSSSAHSYPVFGSETGNSDVYASTESQLDGEKTRESQLSDNTAVMRSREQAADDQLAFVPSLKAVEQLPVNKDTDGFVRTTLNHRPTSTESFQSHARTEYSQSREMSLAYGDDVKGTMSNHAVNKTGDKQVSVSSSRSCQRDDMTSRCLGASQSAALPSESASSGLAGLKAMHNKSSASFVPVSESSSNGSSLYRRRVMNLLLKQGNNLNEGFEAELPKSPRIQNHFESTFEHDDSSVPNNGCGNFHKERCQQEHKDDMKSGTDGALCHSDYKSEHAARTGCHSGHPSEQKTTSQTDTLSVVSSGVVNFATVSSEAVDKDCHARVSCLDCSYGGQLMKDGVKSGCAEKSLHVNAGGLSRHTLTQCCTDVSTCHLSPVCHLPIKVSPAGVRDVTAKCCMAHHLGSLPTPTRACAAALCQLSCSGIPPHADSPAGLDSSSECHFGHATQAASQCTTPCHQALVKCACVGDGHLAPVLQAGCPCTVKKSSVRGCSARMLHQDPVQQLGDTQPHTPCMAHTPYTPRETYTTREPDTPQDSNGVCEPCTPQSLCSHRARKFPCTPTAACFFQFPPLHVSQLDCSGSGICQSPCVSKARRLPSCHTPCMSPLNLTVGQACIAHTSTPQCCFQHQKMTSCTSRHRHNCVCLYYSQIILISCFSTCYFYTVLIIMIIIKRCIVINYHVSSYASAVLAVIILSVCLSHTCFVTKPILIPHERQSL